MRAPAEMGIDSQAHKRGIYIYILCIGILTTIHDVEIGPDWIALILILFAAAWRTAAGGFGRAYPYFIDRVR